MGECKCVGEMEREKKREETVRLEMDRGHTSERGVQWHVKIRTN